MTSSVSAGHLLAFVAEVEIVIGLMNTKMPTDFPLSRLPLSLLSRRLVFMNSMLPIKFGSLPSPTSLMLLSFRFSELRTIASDSLTVFVCSTTSASLSDSDASARSSDRARWAAQSRPICIARESIVLRAEGNPCCCNRQNVSHFQDG